VTEEVAGQGEPRRTGRRTYTGRRLSLPQWAEILCGAAGLAVGELCTAHKGSRHRSEVRERFIHVAMPIMYYPTVEVARFLHITSAAVTLANRRYDQKLSNNPQSADSMIRLLSENT
jgi:hypothetical protein